MTSPRLFIALAALALAPALLGLDNELPEVDPAQYADVAARMLRRGNFLVPEDTFGPHLNKPPLMMWSEALSMAVFGQDSFGARLPVVLWAVLATWAVYRVGRALRDAKLGAVAACLFAVSTALHHMVADPKVDLPLTATTTLAIWAVLESRSRPRFIWAAWVFAGFAVLSKGPLGIVVVVLALAPDALGPRWTEPPRPFWRRVLALRPFSGLAVAAAIASSFYIAVGLGNGWRAAFDLLWTQGFGRVLGQTPWMGDTTPAFFLHTGLWAFLPASPLVVAGLWRRAASLWKTRRLPPGLESIPLWWLLLPMAVVSVPSYKLPQHIYCLAPAAALLAAQELFAVGELGLRRWRRAFLALGLVAAGVAVFLLVWAFPGSALRLLAWAAFLAAVPLAAFLFGRKAEPVAATALAAVGSLAGFFAFFHGALQPSLLAFQPWREVGRHIRALEPSAPFLAFAGSTWNYASAFYAGRHCLWLEPHDLAERVRRGELAHAVLSDDVLDAVRDAGLRWTVVERLPTYGVSMPRADFLNARTRPGTLGWLQFVRLEAAAPSDPGAPR